MSTFTGKQSARSLQGPAVLLSRAGVGLSSFWLLLLLALVLPTPLRSILGSARPKGSAPGASTLGGPRGADTPPASARPSHNGSPPSATEPTAGQPIEDARGSLRPLARALRQRSQLVRVLHLGDSQIDLDHVSGQMRRRMQRRYGDGGHGFFPAIRPWRWFRQPGIAYPLQNGAWHRYRLGGGGRPDNYLGIGMLAAESSGRASSHIALSDAVAGNHLILSYLAGPGRGRFELFVDGERPIQRSTAHATNEARSLTLPISKGAHKLRIVTHGRVRLFGLALERRGEGGLTWENLPAISGRFYQLAQLDEAIFARQLAQRRPAMVVFQFGANDAIRYGKTIASYQKRVSAALKRVTGLAETACLVIGPLDQQERFGGKLQPRRTLERVLAAQRAAARATGCAFWDARAAMGGEGSIVGWRAKRLVRADMVHLNKKGAAELARLLDAALETSLRRFR